MNVWLLILGLALILLVFMDALWTTLWVDNGAGPLSARISTWLWRGTLALSRKNHKRLSIFGPFILMLSLTLWIALLWAGWMLIFGSVESALLEAHEGTPADWAARFYFVGYMIFTAGNGDYTPNGDVWQMAAALCNATGMILVTLGITFLLSVVSAVVAKRALAGQVMGLGETPVGLVLAGWNGRDFRSLDLPLIGIASSLTALSQQYEAYPILQYYHAARAQKSPIVAVATLDEALTILRYGVPEDLRPNPAVLQSAQASVRSFLETMPGAFIKEAPTPPGLPDLSELSKKGIETVGESEFASAAQGLTERRKKLLGLVRNDGWNWSDPE